LTTARTQALEVERVSDDPPERVHGWVATVSESALQDLDLFMLRDLLRIEEDPALWESMAAIVVGDIERRTLQGDAPSAHALAESLVRETTPEGRPALRAVATRSLERLSAGPLVRHVGVHLRKAEDIEVEFLNRLCHTIGAGVVRPLAELLAVEENPKATRRLRELLLGFGAAGRQSVEKLKNSPNPACAGRRSICCACSADRRRFRSWCRCSTTPIHRSSVKRSAPSCRSGPTTPTPCCSARS
jgi:hypothetical protein